MLLESALPPMSMAIDTQKPEKTTTAMFLSIEMLGIRLPL